MNNGKYDSETVKRIIDALREGETAKRACQIADITQDTFYRWKKERSEFSELVKTAEEEARVNAIAKLEASLYKRANGFTTKEKRSELVANPNGGNPIIVKQVITEKEFAPDTGALVFALSNLDPDKWKNKLNAEHSGEVGRGVTIVVESKEDEELVKRALDR